MDPKLQCASVSVFRSNPGAAPHGDHRARRHGGMYRLRRRDDPQKITSGRHRRRGGPRRRARADGSERVPSPASICIFVLGWTGRRDIRREAVERAVRMSADKILPSASAMLAKTGEMTHDFEIVELGDAPAAGLRRTWCRGHHPRSELHRESHRVRKLGATVFHGCTGVANRFILAHALDDCAAFRIRLGQPNQVAGEMAFDLALGFRESRRSGSFSTSSPASAQPTTIRRGVRPPRPRCRRGTRRSR